MITEEPEHGSIRYYKGSAEISLQNYLPLDDYAANMAQAAADALSILDGWCVPLAVWFALGPELDGHRGDPSTNLLVLADEFDREESLHLDHVEWSDRRHVDAITPDSVRRYLEPRLSPPDTKLREVWIPAARYAVDPPVGRQGYLTTGEANHEVMFVPTVEIDGQPWVVSVDHHSGFPPVAIEMHGGDGYVKDLSAELLPLWSYFGSEQRPGWQAIVKATDRLVASSEDWEIRFRQPGMLRRKRTYPR